MLAKSQEVTHKVLVALKKLEVVLAKFYWMLWKICRLLLEGPLNVEVPNYSKAVNLGRYTYLLSDANEYYIIIFISNSIHNEGTYLYLF